MKKITPADINSDISLAAVCGLFCPSCGVYQATVENDATRLEMIARRLGQTVEETRCTGCRSDALSLHCRHCAFVKCAAEKSILFCGECGQYPCEELKTFQGQAPHRAELWKNHQRIVEAGWEQWFEEMKNHYACPECNTINSAYDPACRQCSHIPSSKYSETNHGQKPVA